MSDDNSGSIEVILQHFLTQMDKYNDAINIRLDKLTESLDDLRWNKDLVIKLEKDVGALEKSFIDLNNRVQIMEHDNKKRDDIAKTITNPLIQKAIWVIICFIVGGGVGVFTYSVKNVEIYSEHQQQRFMSDHQH